MIYEIDFDLDTRSILSHTEPVLKRRIKDSLREIAENPYEGKPLERDLKGYWAYRVGNLRIVYAINIQSRTVNVVTIGPRKIIYDELSRRLRLKRREEPFK